MAFYIFPKAISKENCEKYLEYCLLDAKFEDASTIRQGYNDIPPEDKLCDEQYFEERSNDDTDIRKTQVHFINNKEHIMNEVVWDFIRRANELFFNYKLDYFQAIQFAKYQKGGHYDWHQDTTFTSDNIDNRKLSLTMSLTDHNDYEGGLLEFYNGGKPVTAIFDSGIRDVSEEVREQGTVIVFDSRDWHRVTPVTKGVRYSIVCWTVGPRFV